MESNGMLLKDNAAENHTHCRGRAFTQAFGGTVPETESKLAARTFLHLKLLLTVSGYDRLLKW